MAAKPKVIITIAGRHFLLPDDVGASTVIKTLSRAIPVWDRSYEGKIQIRDQEMEVGMSYLTKPVVYVDENNQPLQPDPPRARKALPAPKPLRLR
jgi:hypothetical protein